PPYYGKSASSYSGNGRVISLLPLLVLDQPAEALLHRFGVVALRHRVYLHLVGHEPRGEHQLTFDVLEIAELQFDVGLLLVDRHLAQRDRALPRAFESEDVHVRMTGDEIVVVAHLLELETVAEAVRCLRGEEVQLTDHQPRLGVLGRHDLLVEQHVLLELHDLLAQAADGELYGVQRLLVHGVSLFGSQQLLAQGIHFADVILEFLEQEVALDDGIAGHRHAAAQADAVRAEEADGHAQEYSAAQHESAPG